LVAIAFGMFYFSAKPEKAFAPHNAVASPMATAGLPVESRTVRLASATTTAWADDAGVDFRFGQESTSSLRLRLEALESSGKVLWTRPTVFPPTRSSAAEAVYDYGLIEERYDVRPLGIEQSFLLREAPAGWAGGDLDLRIGTPGAVAAQGVGASGGVSFLCRNGRPGLHYGAVKVWDADGRELNFLPETSADGALRLRLPAAWLAAARFPLTVDPLVGSNFQIGLENAAVTSGNEVSIAYNPGAAGGGCYLVVWARTEVAGSVRIAATRVQADGTVLEAEGAPLFVSPAAHGSCARPRVASNGDSWLVVWDHAGTDGINVFAARVKNDGTLQDAAPMQLTVVGAGRRAICGGVASDGVNYLAVWADNRMISDTPTDDIRAARIRADGVVSDPQGFLISDGLAVRAEPDVCWGVGRWLVVWRDSRDEAAGQGRNIYGAFVSQAAEVLSGTDDGGGFRITSGVSDAVQPSCAYSVSAGTYLTAWADLRGPIRVMATRLSADGSVLDATPELGVGKPLGRGRLPMRLKVAAVPGPATASGARWAAVWDDTDAAGKYSVGVLLALVGADGSIVHAATNPEGILLSEAIGTFPALAAASSGAEPLAVWFDPRASVGGATAAVRGQFFTASTLSGPVPAYPLEAVINVSNTEGDAPLTTYFDGRASAGNPVAWRWSFGDGASSAASSTSHVYNVAGTYVATLTVTNAGGATNTTSVVVVVSGTGSGTVTPSVNFRWAPKTARFQLNHAHADRDTFVMTAALNTVDLPARLSGVDAAFSINGVFTVSGIMDAYGFFQNTGRTRTPTFSIRVSPIDQELTVTIKRADLRAALALSGADNSDVAAPGNTASVSYTLTVGAQSYTVLAGHAYVSRKNVLGRGDYRPLAGRGAIRDGWCVTALATALENENGIGHFCNLEMLLARPNGTRFSAPTAGVWTVSVGDFVQTIPFDRFREHKGVIAFTQSDRDLGGIRKFTLDNNAKRLYLVTWDLPALGEASTGIPLRGLNYTAYNLTVRVELPQPDGSKFEAVTATRMTRKTKADAFWQTGRRNRKQ
jgi:PKD repeat protein